MSLISSRQIYALGGGALILLTVCFAGNSPDRVLHRSATGGDQAAITTTPAASGVDRSRKSDRIPLPFADRAEFTIRGGFGELPRRRTLEDYDNEPLSKPAPEPLPECDSLAPRPKNPTQRRVGDSCFV
jgi:hypothetical protein